MLIKITPSKKASALNCHWIQYWITTCLVVLETYGIWACKLLYVNPLNSSLDIYLTVTNLSLFLQQNVQAQGQSVPSIRYWQK